MSEPWIVGVDAGGTRTEAWAISRGNAIDSILQTGETGPGNLHSAGFESATANICSAVETATQDQGAVIETICICAAGVGRAQDRTHLSTWAQNRWPRSRVIVRTDIEAVLAAAFPDEVGVALISGTGSLAWGKNAEGQTARCGGWGHLLGDEGSAYSIAQRGLHCVLQMADGRRDETELLRAMLNDLHLETPSEIVPAVYSVEDSRQTIAALAPVVFDCAIAEDPVAAVIVQQAAVDLAVMTDVVASRLGFQSDLPLAMTGGVLLHQPVFREKLMSAMSTTATSVLVPSPVKGALRIAEGSIS